MTFGRAKRLIAPAEFARVKNEGTVQRGQFVLVGVLETGRDEHFRLGLVTSKRVGGAVVRNRIRRRLREIIRKRQEQLRRGIWLVVIARPASARASTAQLEHEWLRLANRASILAPS